MILLQLGKTMERVTVNACVCVYLEVLETHY